MDKPRYPPGWPNVPANKDTTANPVEPPVSPLQQEPAEQAVDPTEKTSSFQLNAFVESAVHRTLHFFGECYGGPLAVINGLMLAVAATIGLWPHLQAPDRYDEPILGVDSLLGGSKAGDMRAFVLLIISGTLFTLACGWIVRHLRGDGSDAARNRTTNTILLLASIPFWAWLSRSAVAPLNVTPPGFAAAFTLVGLALVYVLGRLRTEMDHPALVRIGAMGLLTAFVSMMSGLAIATFVCRTPIGAERLAGSLNWLPWLSLFAGTLVFLIVLWTITPAEPRELLLGKILLIAQIPLPLLYFAVVTPPTLTPTGERFNETSITLPILVGLVAAGTWFGWWRSWMARPVDVAGTAGSLRRWMAPTALCAIAVFMSAAPIETPKLPYKGSLGAVPENGTLDDFHPAEALLPWQQWKNFGKVPFIDLMPPMGGRTMLMGLANQTFFDGTFVGILAADNLLLALGAAALFATAWIVIGPTAAMAVSFGVLGEGRLIPMVPVALMLCTPKVFKKSILWLYLWVSAGAVLLLYNPSVGVILLAGGFPLAMLQMYKAFRASPLNLAIALGTVIAAAAIVGVSPLGKIFRGTVQFVAENAVGYSQSAGIPSLYSWSYPDRGSYPVGSMFAFEVLRNGWILLVPLCLALLARELALQPEKRRVSLCLFILLIVPEVLLLYNWALVRIAPDTWSRPGILTGIIICQILPIILLTRGRWWNGTLAAVMLGAAASALELSPLLAGGLDAMNQRASAERRIASVDHIVRGPQVGIPSLGDCEGPHAVVQRYVNLNNALSNLLNPDETFFDLSNRNNIYIYANRRVPTPYSAMYYAPTRLLQERMLEGLRRDPVPVAVLWPAMAMDGNSSFRCYPVVRKFLLNYVAVKRDPWILLVDPARVPEAGPIGSEAQLQLLDQALAPSSSNLQGMPVIWGQSWPNMADLFTPVEDITRLGSVQSNPTTIAYDLSSRSIRGRDADFLFLQFRIRQTSALAQTWVGVAWNARGLQPGTERSIGQTAFAAPLPMMYERFRMGAVNPPPTPETSYVTALVPLGCSPRWLLSSTIQGLTVGIPEAKSVTEFAITKAQLMKFKPITAQDDLVR